MKKQLPVRLLKKYLDGRATVEEKVRIHTWYESVEESKQVNQQQMDDMKEALFLRIMVGLKTAPPVVPLYRKPLFRMAAAASILVLLSLGAYQWFLNKPDQPTRPVPVVVKKDVEAPATNRAMITLVDGQQVYLDSINNGQLTLQGNVKLVKLANGQIAYQKASGETATELQYNTLMNPRGSKVINMTLTDGSKVWLNAGSSVTYPVAFTGNERNITITGEAYFEVAHDKTRPFKVSRGATMVEVLGTHFNVNAYDDEPDMRVTLLEGSVKVKSDVGSRKSDDSDPTSGPRSQTSIILKPGEQAIHSRLTIDDSRLTIHHLPNIDDVMAWKNGWFNFNGLDLKAVMRQLERWYDIKVQYQGSVDNGVLKGRINRNVNLSDVLDILQKVGEVKFKLEGKTLIVL